MGLFFVRMALEPQLMGVTLLGRETMTSREFGSLFEAKRHVILGEASPKIQNEEVVAHSGQRHCMTYQRATSQRRKV